MANAKRGFTIFFTSLGVLSFLGMVGLLLLLVAAGMGRAPVVPEGGVLVLRVGGALAEVAPADVVGFLRGARTPTVRSVVETLRKAKMDSRIRAVILKPTGFDSPFWGKVQEVRDAVLDFKTSGKPVHAYLEYGGDREYYLATAADRIALMPASALDLTGVATYQVFLRGTLDRIGAVADIHHVGDYKTAPNTFTERGYTPTHKAVDESLTRDLFAQIVAGVAVGRQKTEAEVRAIVDRGPFLPEAAREAGLIDAVQYEDQVYAGLSAAEAGQRIDGDDYARVSDMSLGLGRGPRVAVIYAAGTISSGRTSYDPVNGAIVGAETLIGYIRQVRRDPSIRALVLRIDSPGGSATASDAVWRELMTARTERADRPIIASMSDLAASGGYYIALPAEAIVAQPSTLTGSIGVFGGKIVTGGTYEKLGARIESTSVGKLAEMNSPARPYTPAEIAKVDEQLQDFYDQFVKKVAESRKSTPQNIHALAQGRVWTGRQAEENGLVDALGGLDRAIALAKERAKIPAGSDVQLIVYPPRRSFFELLSDELNGVGASGAANAWLSANLTSSEMDALRLVRGPLAMFRRGEVLALMPFTFLR